VCRSQYGSDNTDRGVPVEIEECGTGGGGIGCEMKSNGVNLGYGAPTGIEEHGQGELSTE
jgi:hypothetical protein